MSAQNVASRFVSSNARGDRYMVRALVAILAFLGLIQVFAVVARVLRLGVHPIVREELRRIPYALPLLFGMTIVAWVIIALTHKQSVPLPHEYVMIASLVAIMVGVIVWREGPRLVKRIVEVGPVKFTAAQEELTY